MYPTKKKILISDVQDSFYNIPVPRASTLGPRIALVDEKCSGFSDAVSLTLSSWYSLGVIFLSDTILDFLGTQFKEFVVEINLQFLERYKMIIIYFKLFQMYILQRLKHSIIIYT